MGFTILNIIGLITVITVLGLAVKFAIDVINDKDEW